MDTQIPQTPDTRTYTAHIHYTHAHTYTTYTRHMDTQTPYTPDKWTQTHTTYTRHMDTHAHTI